MIPAELILNYLAKEDPARLEKVRQAQAEDEEKATALLELIEEELKQNTSGINAEVLRHANDRTYLRSLEDQYASEGIKYLDTFASAKTLRTFAKHVLAANNVLTLFVSKEKNLSGKITNQLYPFKQKIPIAYEVEEKTTFNTHYFSIGEKLDRNKFRLINTLHGHFWMYQFNTGKRQYVLLSEEALESKEYTIEGTVVEFEDLPLLGSTLRLNTIFSVLIVHTAKSKVPVFTNHEELINATKKITREAWMSALFTHPQHRKAYRHPHLFETLISSALLSAPQDYHLHLMIIGKKGTGKSTMEECIWHKFKETQEIIGCGQSTLKALVPSFKTNPPSPGALINASRIAVVDEFLRILMSIEKDDREHQLSRLNDLLENRQRTFSSGNGSINGRMTAKFLAVTNPVWGTSTMEHLCEYIDESFLSRLFIWYQQDEHVKFVRSEQGIKPPSTLPENLLLGVYDYCQTFTSKYDDTQVKEVFTQIRDLLAQDESMKRSADTYEARYLHHCRCLIDGIVKTRCITTQDSHFTARQEDYETLKNILEAMVIQWGINALPNQKIRGNTT